MKSSSRFQIIASLGLASASPTPDLANRVQAFDRILQSDIANAFRGGSQFDLETFDSAKLKKNSRNFRVNREMREKICVIRPYFGRIFDENAVETQNRALPKFQILVPKSKSEFEI